jgi:hypothetical protein
MSAAGPAGMAVDRRRIVESRPALPVLPAIC